MDRREILKVAASMLAAPGVAIAQTQKRFRVGCLYLAEEAFVRPFQEAFLAGMRERGYVLGRNLDVDLRSARGDDRRLPELVDELIALKPDVLLGIEAIAMLYRSKTTTIPIVLSSSSDPVAAGLVKSLARPATNVTGMANFVVALVGKHIELLKEILPKATHLALVNDPFIPAAARFEESAMAAARAKGIKLSVVRVRDPVGVREAFAALEKEPPQGVVVVSSGRMNQLRNDVLGEVRRLRLPSISGLPPAAWADLGGLASHSADIKESYRRSADFIDRILKGANPAELPIEQATKFELIINLKTARELGLTIPNLLLLRADRVIE